MDLQVIAKRTVNSELRSTPENTRFAGFDARYRQKLIQAASAEKNRIQKILENANVKLLSEVSDTFGVSASRMIKAIMSGNFNTESLAKLAVGKLKGKKKKLKEALQGHFRNHHGFMIQASLEKIIADLDRQIDEKLKDFHRERELLVSIPGVKEQGSSSILAEIGADMNVFPSEGHLSAWAGMSLGNNESAGKKSGKITHGNKNLRSILTQGAWVARKMKNTYLSAKYYSLVGRRGKKRALIAVGHKILIMAYQILKTGIPYKKLGHDYLSRRKEDRIVKDHIKRLKDLGYQVELKKAVVQSLVKEKNDSTGERSHLTGGYDPVIETDLARRKNKGMLPRARRGNFYDLPRLLLITLSNKAYFKRYIFRGRCNDFTGACNYALLHYLQWMKTPIIQNNELLTVCRTDVRKVLRSAKNLKLFLT